MVSTYEVNTNTTIAKYHAYPMFVANEMQSTLMQVALKNFTKFNSIYLLYHIHTDLV